MNGTTATMASPLAVNPVTVPSGNLWTVDGFSFVITSESEGPVSTSSLTLTGQGVISYSGSLGTFDPTLGSWTAVFSQTGGAQFGWNDVNFAQVPDGGMTVMMLGAAFTGLSLVKRKLA